MRALHERGVKCAIASSSYRELIDELVEIAGIADVLDYTIRFYKGRYALCSACAKKSTHLVRIEAKRIKIETKLSQSTAKNV